MLKEASQVVVPLARVGVRLYATWRLNWVLSVALSQAPAFPLGLGFLVHGGVRMLVAARLGAPANSAGEESQPLAGSEGRKGHEAPAAQPRTGKRPAGPRGLPALPHRPNLRSLIPGPDRSTRPIGLPLNFLAQTAARGPMYRFQGDRLLRGVVGLAATLLLCRRFPTPFTKRKAWLPPRLFEQFYHKILGPVAALSYLYMDPTQLGMAPGDRAVCKASEPAIQQAYSRMREAGAKEAARLGRDVAFAVPGAEGVQAIGADSINACCLPGGIVFVHSGLIRAVGGSKQALSFVVGHEVGHAIGRHGLEKATLVYGGMFCIDILVGLAERLLQGKERSGMGDEPPTLPPGPDSLGGPAAAQSGLAVPRGAIAATVTAPAWTVPGEAASGQEEGEGCGEGIGSGTCRLLRSLDAALQSGLYLLQLRQSRRHEFEADELALHLGTHAGMDRAWLASGAQLTLQQFMRMEGQGAFQQLAGPEHQAADNNPLSTHPAATNRLRRLVQVFRGGGGT